MEDNVVLYFPTPNRSQEVLGAPMDKRPPI